MVFSLLMSYLVLFCQFGAGVRRKMLQCELGVASRPGDGASISILFSSDYGFQVLLSA